MPATQEMFRSQDLRERSNVARRGVMLRHLALLLAVAVLYFPIAGNDGCGDEGTPATGPSESSPQTTKKTVPPPKLKCTSEHSWPEFGGGVEGETVHHKLTVVGAPNAFATVTYTPPNIGAMHSSERQYLANLTFHGQQPDNPDGPAPYVFSNVPEGSTIWVSFSAPSVRDFETTSNYFSSFTARADDQGVHWDSMINVRRNKTAVWHRALSRPGDGPFRRAAAAKDETYMVWQWEHWFPVAGAEMTTERCRQWLEIMQNPDLYIAVRFPLIDTIQGVGPTWQVPIAYRDGLDPVISLIRYPYPPETVVSLPVELRRDRLDLVSSFLPQVEGEQYMVFSASPNAAAFCPDDLQIDVGAWEIYSNMHLDLGGDESTCEGCNLQVFLCWAGSESPLSNPVKAGLEMAFTSIRNEWLTAIGPFPLRLAPFNDPPNPPLNVSGPGMQRIDAPAEVWFHHWVANMGDDPIEASFSVTSELGLDWRLYEGTPSGPDLDSPVVGPVNIDSWINLWLWADIQAGIGGPETVVLEATATVFPDTPVSNTDVLWIGDWTPVDDGVVLPVDPTPIDGIDSPCP